VTNGKSTLVATLIVFPLITGGVIDGDGEDVGTGVGFGWARTGARSNVLLANPIDSVTITSITMMFDLLNHRWIFVKTNRSIFMRYS
jgi:hypothetical protein